MLKNSKLMLVALALGVLSMLVVACGTTEPEVEPTPVEVEAAEEAVVEEVAAVDPEACNIAAPDSPVTITYFGWPFEIMEFYAAEMEKCGEVENIEVDVQFLDFVAVGEQVDLALSGGGESPYDILHMSNVEMANNSNNGWLYPLNDLIDKYRDEYDLGDIAAASFQGATVDGQIYGIPAINNTLHLAYRSDLFEQYGIEVPTNYDEVIAACEVLADEPSIDYPFTMDLSADWAWEIEFLAFVRGYGSDYLNDDLTPAFNGPEGVAGLTKMKEVVDACMGPEGLAGSPYETAEVTLNTGGQAFIHIWASNTVSMFDPEVSDFADVIKFAPAAAPNPGGPLGGSAWTDYYGIPATTTNDPELVFLIIMEALDNESMDRGAELGAVTRNSITKGLPNKPALSETVANGIGIYDTHPAVALAQAALWKFLPFVGTGEMTPQEALDAAAEDYIAEATAQGYLE